MFTSTIRMGKKCALMTLARMTAGGRQGGLSISETADLLEFSHTTVSRVYSEWCEKNEETSSGQQFYRQKHALLMREVR